MDTVGPPDSDNSSSSAHHTASPGRRKGVWRKRGAGARASRHLQRRPGWATEDLAAGAGWRAGVEPSPAASPALAPARRINGNTHTDTSRDPTMSAETRRLWARLGTRSPGGGGACAGRGLRGAGPARPHPSPAIPPAKPSTAAGEAVHLPFSAAVVDLRGTRGGGNKRLPSNEENQLEASAPTLSGGEAVYPTSSPKPAPRLVPSPFVFSQDP